MIKNIIFSMMKPTSGTPSPVVASSAASSRNNNNTSDVITMPSGIASGDTLLVFSLHSTTTYTSSGWTEITTHPSSVYWAFWKIATGSEGVSQTFTASTTGRFEAIAVRITGANATTPIDGSVWGTLIPASAIVTASTATNVMTVTAVTSGSLSLGDLVTHGSASFPSNVHIQSFGSGGGGTGTYNLDTTVGTFGSGQVNGNAPTLAATNITPSVADGLLITTYFLSTIFGSTIETTTVDASETLIKDSYIAGRAGCTSAYKQLSSASPVGIKYLTHTRTYTEYTSLSIIIKP